MTGRRDLAERVGTGQRVFTGRIYFGGLAATRSRPGGSAGQDGTGRVQGRNESGRMGRVGGSIFFLKFRKIQKFSKIFKNSEKLKYITTYILDQKIILSFLFKVQK
jgi:hypothetical protein